MGFRHPNPRRVKIHRNYSVEDVATLFGAHKNTVRTWLKQGLQAIDDRRPQLITGAELVRFLKERRARSKQSCGPGRIYCLKCRAPKEPAGNFAECILQSETRGNLGGICPDCERMIYRRVNPQKLDVVRGDLDISVTQPLRRLEETSMPSVNCDFSAGGQP